MMKKSFEASRIAAKQPKTSNHSIADKQTKTSNDSVAAKQTKTSNHSIADKQTKIAFQLVVSYGVFFSFLCLFTQMRIY